MLLFGISRTLGHSIIYSIVLADLPIYDFLLVFYRMLCIYALIAFLSGIERLEISINLTLSELKVRFKLKANGAPGLT